MHLKPLALRNSRELSFDMFNFEAETIWKAYFKT